MSNLSTARVSARLRAATLVKRTLRSLVKAGNHRATQDEVAAHLEVSPQRVADLCKDGNPAWALGDILALPPAIARAILRAALAELPEDTADGIHDAILAVNASAGELCAILRRAEKDDHIDDGEWRELEAAALEQRANADVVLAACARRRR